METEEIVIDPSKALEIKTKKGHNSKVMPVTVGGDT